MRIIFEVGLEPFQLLNRYGGVILFLVIASLALVPLASLYVVLAVSHSLLLTQQCSLTLHRALQVCSEATLYYSLFFPFLLGFFSTQMSYRMILLSSQQQTVVLSEEEIRYQLQKHSMKLTNQDVIKCSDSTTMNAMRILTPDNSSSRKISGECSICLRQYECGEEIAWSPNNNKANGVTKCPHAFHFSCIQTWLTRNRSCPCCRQPFLNLDTKGET